MSRASLNKHMWLFRLTSPHQTLLWAAAAAAKSLQSCPTLWDPIDGSPPGSPVPGILQARILEWVAISFSNAWKWKVTVELLSRVQLSVTPGSSIHGIFQARVLESGAIAFYVLWATDFLFQVFTQYLHLDVSNAYPKWNNLPYLNLLAL